ncbi:MAG TPA: hypothetical protein VJO52_00655 [Gemmatimonadaceae bacterium]|nr:hypothetical protein [Gemmatimonadaceae bacterium]
MTTLSRWMRATVLIGVAVTGLASCSMNVDNPSVIDAGKFNPNSDGATLALSAQTNFYLAFQSVALFGGLISDEVWTGAVRLQTNRLSARNFVGTDDINADFFAPLSLAVASNENAASVLSKGANASTDLNLATASMNLGFSLDVMAETMCSGVIQGGPELSDTQLLDTAVTAFTQAIAVATAAGPAGATIVNASNVGLARAYLQMGDFANAAATAALVPPGFVINVVTTTNTSTLGSLANTYVFNALQGQIIAPKLYRIGDPRMPIDSTTPGATLNQLPYVIQAKYTSYADPIRLGSGLEAQYIQAEAEIHASSATSDALALIGARRAAGNQSAYSGGTDTLSVLSELLNQRARDFWMEGKKLGDLRRNPSVPLSAVLTDPVGAPFYTNSGGGPFGATFCAPIPPQETDANPNF